MDQINQLKVSREFFLSFSENPQEFITNWLISQNRDLKVGKVTPTIPFVEIFLSRPLIGVSSVVEGLARNHKNLGLNPGHGGLPLLGRVNFNLRG